MQVCLMLFFKGCSKVMSSLGEDKNVKSMSEVGKMLLETKTQ